MNISLHPQLDGMRWRAGLAYGLFGFPLAFAALPLYVVLPNYYARSFGLSLASVGALLMMVRLMDALLEPWLGRVSDALFARSTSTVLWVGACVALLQWIGMVGLFFPIATTESGFAQWLVMGMLLTCVAHSLLAIAHQAWGVRLGGSELLRSRIVAWREGLGLAGVMTASVLSVVYEAWAMLAVFGCALLLGWGLWWRAPQPVRLVKQQCLAEDSLWMPLAQHQFRKLLAVFICNGIASAIPAALMLFFAQDRLRADDQATAIFLVIYFIFGAVSMPLWLRLVGRLGLSRSWLIGMLLAVVCFSWTAGLKAGETEIFALICALTGLALGADLALPGALLAQLIDQQGAQGSREGAYLGWWSLANKLNLALAAGAVLPLLQWLGYVPGSQNEQALEYLSWVYALVPCFLKFSAALLLYVLFVRRESPSIEKKE